jgi:dolichol-phosphate mannosyltransferase
VSFDLISLIVPCYNEEETIGAFFRRVQSLSASMEQEFELIFVNDGSTDETGTILNNLAQQDKRVKVLHLAQNRGHQIALTAGLDFASGDMIVTIDADLQDPPELVREMLKKIAEGYDIVHAQRRRRSGETVFKLATARLFYRLIKLASQTPIIENCGDFRAFTRPVLETVRAFRAPSRFMRGIFVQVGFRQCVVQYNRDGRYAGETKYSLLRMINLAMDAVLGYSSAPIRVILWASGLLWIISLLYLVKALVAYYALNITIPGWTSIIVLQFFFSGLILFCIAIIGSYVGRIFVQGQNSPLYWLCDTRNIDWTRTRDRAMELREVRLSRRTFIDDNENDNVINEWKE